MWRRVAATRVKLKSNVQVANQTASTCWLLRAERDLWARSTGDFIGVRLALGGTTRWAGVCRPGVGMQLQPQMVIYLDNWIGSGIKINKRKKVVLGCYWCGSVAKTTATGARR